MRAIITPKDWAVKANIKKVSYQYALKKYFLNQQNARLQHPK
jgi:hypothetical protein